MDFENDENATTDNLNTFLKAAKNFGVDEAHLFELDSLDQNPDPDADTLEGIRFCLAALKTIIEQRGTLEKQNIWRKDAAEVRQKQNNVANTFHNKENKTLSDVTGAVRRFKGNTNQDSDLRYQKQGQQKWNLFETNYQREKGITLEQSLQEIEEFERTGKMPESMKKKGATRGVGGASSGFRGELEVQLNKDKDGKTKGKSSFQNGNNKPGGSSQTRSGGGMVKNGRPELNEKPQRGGGKGAAFYQKYAAKENSKFKPGSGPNKKLW